MPYQGDPIAEKLDKIAEATGMPRLSRRLNSALPIRFRFLPVALLTAAVAGLWVQIAVSDMFGYLIVMMAWMAASAIQAFSAAGNARGGRLDEREVALVRSGHSAGYLAAMVVAVLGCFLLGMASVANQFRLGAFWVPEIGTDWFALAFFLLAVENAVAVMAASARLPEDLDDDE
jgi:energy-converting hydrogenase Eha subunit A